MASISAKETKPEVLVRSFLFKKGFRFRKNVKSLLCTPDIVLTKYRTAIFTNGCFWHGHNCKKGARPESNIKFWNTKIQNNIDRDKRVKNDLKKNGWDVLTIWGCELSNKKLFDKAMTKITKRLNAR